MRQKLPSFRMLIITNNSDKKTCTTLRNRIILYITGLFEQLTLPFNYAPKHFFFFFDFAHLLFLDLARLSITLLPRDIAVFFLERAFVYLFGLVRIFVRPKYLR